MWSACSWLLLIVLGLLFLGMALYLWGYFTARLRVVTPCSTITESVPVADSSCSASSSSASRVVQPSAPSQPKPYQRVISDDDVDLLIEARDVEQQDDDTASTDEEEEEGE